MEKKKQFFQKHHHIFNQVLSYILIFAMVLGMGAFSQLDGIIAKAADGDIKSPVIKKNEDGTYNVTFNYQENETSNPESVKLMGSGFPDTAGVSWTADSSVTMTKNNDSGIWSVTISNVPQGTKLEYKFLLDGSTWIDDPLNKSETEGGNSIFTLPADFTHKSPEVNGKEVTFRYWSDTAEKVQLAGSMTNWADGAIELVKGDNDIWELAKALPAGIHEYKFIVNGKDWVNDQVNSDLNEGGNNKVVVPGLADGTLSIVKGKEAVLPELYLYKADGTAEKVKASYSLKDTGLAEQVTISDGKITVSNGYAGDSIVLVASYKDETSGTTETSEVTVSAGEAAAGEGITLKVYYHREDGIYDDWNLYMWDEDGNDSITGGQHDFTEKTEDGSVSATVDVKPGAGKLGYIVRHSTSASEWAEKDVEDDQFINLLGVVSGTVSLYIESGIKNEEYVNGDDVKTTPMIRSAVYNEDNHTITVEMTEKIKADDDINTAFAVSGNDGEVSVLKTEDGGSNVYIVYLKDALGLSKQYSIIFGDRQYAVQMPVYYATKEFEDKYTYTGNDLGATWTKDKTTFRVWAPEADSVDVNLYTSGTEGTDDLTGTLNMAADINGTWVAEKEGDLKGTYYTYTITRDGNKTENICDPYARTTGVNGKRAMVIDLDSTNPAGWESDSNPHEGEGITDAIIYEGHVRDLTVGGKSGVSEANKGKFAGLAETGATAVNHMKELGITHLHLLPVYDFGSVDETGEGDQYNWGYDPVNYNVPEGSYSTDPSNGETRVKEFKQMVQSLHNNDISVIMDVVYNHVYDAEEFCVNKLVPKYFSRFGRDGKLYGDSECGNDTASERSMVRKYIVDSVCYWADEYHIDGFRFDLVGLLDIDTINQIVEEVHKKHPGVIFYGEGWSMANDEVTGKYTMATQANSTQTPGFAYFNDSIRDTLKGHVFNDEAAGYISGEQGDEEKVAKNFLGAADWCSSPSQTINYVSCHDNHTLFDRIANSRPDASEEDLIRMNNLAAAIYIMSEGVPFMQAGEEFLRRKINEDGSFNHNSYNAGDAVNAIQWGSLEETANADVFKYYKGLIAFRKAHGALRLSDAADVAKTVSVVDGMDKNVVAFDIKGGINGETADEIFVIFNANTESATVTLPDGEWAVYVNDKNAGTDVLGTITNRIVETAPISAMVLIRTGAGKNETEETTKPGTSVVFPYLPGPSGTTPEPVASATPQPAASTTPEPVASATPQPAASATPEPVASTTPQPTASAAPGPAASTTPQPVASTTPSNPKTGQIVKDTKSDASYRVTKPGNGGTVAYQKPLGKNKTVTIPGTVKISGKTYKVTSIAANTFKNNQKLKKAVIGKNIKKIGKKAFYGCKKLKNIVIKSKKLTKKNIGAEAFKGISAKATVKVPKGKVKVYKKLLRSKGLSKKVIVRK